MGSVEESRAKFIAARGGKGVNKLGGARRNNGPKKVSAESQAKASDAKVWGLLNRLQMQPIADVGSACFKKTPLAEGETRPDGEKDCLIIEKPKVNYATQQGITVIEGFAREADHVEFEKTTTDSINMLKNLLASKNAVAPGEGAEDTEIPPLMEVEETAD